jgi:transposase-like protein
MMRIRYTDAEKREIIAEACVPGTDHRALAAKYGIAPETLSTWKWQKNFGQGRVTHGLSGRKKAPEVLAKISQHYTDRRAKAYRDANLSPEQIDRAEQLRRRCRAYTIADAIAIVLHNGGRR